MNKYTVYLKNRETITIMADEWKNSGDHMIFLKDHEEVTRVNWDDFAALKKWRIFFF